MTARTAGHISQRDAVSYDDDEDVSAYDYTAASPSQQSPPGTAVKECASRYALSMGPRVVRFRTLSDVARWLNNPLANDTVAAFLRFGRQAIKDAATARGRVGPIFTTVIFWPRALEQLDSAAMASANKKKDQQKQPPNDAKKTRLSRTRRWLEYDTIRGLLGYIFGAPACGTFVATAQDLEVFPPVLAELLDVCSKAVLDPLPQMAGDVADRQAVAQYVFPKQDDEEDAGGLPPPLQDEGEDDEEDEGDDEPPATRKTIWKSKDTFQGLNQHKCDLNGTLITDYMTHVERNTRQWFVVLAITRVLATDTSCLNDFTRTWRLAHQAFDRFVQSKPGAAAAAVSAATTTADAAAAAAATAPAAAVASAADAAVAAATTAPKKEAKATKKRTAPAAVAGTAPADTLAAETRAKAAQKEAKAAQKRADAARAKFVAASAGPAKAAALKLLVAANRAAFQATVDADAKAARVVVLKKKDEEAAAQEQADSNSVALYERHMHECLTARDPNESRLPTEVNLKAECNVFFWFSFARDASIAVEKFNERAKKEKLRELRTVHVLPRVKPHQSFVQFGIQSMADLLVKFIGADVVPDAWRTDADRKKLPRDKVVAAFAKVLPPGTLDWDRFWVFSFATDGYSIRASGHMSSKDTAAATGDAVEFARKARTKAFDGLRGSAKTHGHRAVRGKQQATRRVLPEHAATHCKILEQQLAVKQMDCIKELCRRFQSRNRADLIKVMCAIDPGVTNIATIIFAFRQCGVWTVDRYQQLRLHYASLLKRRAAAKRAGRDVPYGVEANIDRLEAKYPAHALCPKRHRKPIVMSTAGLVARSGRYQLRREEQAFQKGNPEYRQLMERARKCKSAAERLKIDEEFRKLDIKHRGRRSRKYTSLLRRKAAIDEFVNRIVGNYKKEEVVIGVGDWALRPTTGRFKVAPPIKQLLAALEKRATVVMLQEYHTSAACCQCGERTTTNALRDAIVKKEQKKKPAAAPATEDAAPGADAALAVDAAVDAALAVDAAPAAQEQARPAQPAADASGPPYVSKRAKRDAMKARKTAQKIAKAKAKAEAEAARKASKAMKATKATAVPAARTAEDAAAAALEVQRQNDKDALWRGKQKETRELLQQDVGTRPRHGTAVCAHVNCGILWQRDINGATNLLRLLLEQIDKGEQTNNSRPESMKYDRDMEQVPRDFAFADLVAARHNTRLDSDNAWLDTREQPPEEHAHTERERERE